MTTPASPATFYVLSRELAEFRAADWLAAAFDTPAVQSLARRVEQGGILSLPGVAIGAHAFTGILLASQFPARPVVLIAESLKSQELLLQDATTWSRVAGRTGPILFYPGWEILPQDTRLPHPDVISDRLETLVGLTSYLQSRAAPTPVSPPMVITNVFALMQRTFPADAIRTRTRRLARGDRVDPLDLIEWLEAQGYEPEAQVTQKGEIALRGGILDLYPLTSPWPVRLEFFGDELESLRQFDPHTQMSRDEIQEVMVPPAGELGLLKRAFAGAAADHPPWQPASLLDYLPPGALVLRCEPGCLEERAREYAQEVGEADFLYLAWDEFTAESERRGMVIIDITEDAPGMEAPRPPPLEEPGGESSGGTQVENPPDDEWPVGRLPAPLPETAPEPEFRIEGMDAFRPLPERAPEPHVAEAQRREFFSQMHRWLRQGMGVHVFCNNEGERQRFTEIWAEYGLAGAPADTADEPAPAPQPTLHLGALARGFVFDGGRLAVITDAEIFGRYRVQRPRRLKSAHAQAARSALDIDFTELEEGDYVVHLQHGIGRYLGLQVLPPGAGTRPTDHAHPTGGGGQECLVIEYASHEPAQPAPKLYVPVTEAHLVGKYVGTGKARPPLNTLGGTRWAKAKAQAERAVRDVAGELLAIQAARESQPGHACGLDAPWQREFESSFIYEETPDQLQAINQTKQDMERPKPMDRLICGDVGFGKTEVAIRAAFKVVMDGRQAAVLVPTTVLAQQHFNTFRERMSDYPVRVELLSRFRTRREQSRVVQDLANGAVDIVIGTHRLLQGDIAFKDLGLVVIDEEQRFGVLHKEKFKMLRRLVDVLTLSATPIPRTLYLALTGARDMSTIQTPPHDRLPVETIVLQYDERTIRDAVLREINRGGQVFFLHNRVATISVVAAKLRDLVPRARIVVGHGQMNADELEEVMTAFINGEADVLISTTIIESGLDIPNANTIIIDRADRFGLSDLYQLRGRVGRYKHQAYAYLLLPRHANLLTDVRKRLSAIKQYSSLGSGFKIAMRDLEIRGAGNLLGSEQSGHITAVGFELYCQLLKQSVAALQGEKIPARVNVEVRLDFLVLNPVAGREEPLRSAPPPPKGGERKPARGKPPASKAPLPPAGPVFAYIPFNYISDPRQRVEVYRKVAQLGDELGLRQLQKEVRDRFGPIPEALDWLFQVSDLKLLAASRGVTEVEVREDRLMLTRNHDYVMAGPHFPRLTKTQPAAKLREIRQFITMLAPQPA